MNFFNFFTYFSNFLSACLFLLYSISVPLVFFFLSLFTVFTMPISFTNFFLPISLCHLPCSSLVTTYCRLYMLSIGCLLRMPSYDTFCLFLNFVYYTLYKDIYFLLFYFYVFSFRFTMCFQFFLHN